MTQQAQVYDITLRDLLAMVALHAEIVAGRNDNCVAEAWGIADLMLLERDE